jgi:hypothetical protein
MLALAEILALVILNALVQSAFARWKLARRSAMPKRPAPQRLATRRLATHYRLHPSPTAWTAAPAPEAPRASAGIDG